MRIVFIASTLPALFLKNKIEEFKIHIIVFHTKELMKMYKFFLKNDFKYYLFEDTLSGNNDFYNIYNINNDFIVFHECCWTKLDKLIVKKNIRTKYYPIVSLNGCLDLREKNIFSILKIYGFSLITLKSYFRYIIENFFNNFLLFYLMPKDGENNDFILIKSLNYYDISNNKVSKKAYGFKNITQTSQNSKKIIFLIGTDVIDTKLIIYCINEIISFCQINKINFIAKFHPRANKNLISQFRIKEADIFEKQIPFEISNIEYRYKISLFSTSLIFEPNKSISLEKIIEKKLDKRSISKFNLRKKHLRSFSDFEKIIIPPSLNNLYDLLK